MQAARPWIAQDSNPGSGECDDTAPGRRLEPGVTNPDHEDCEDKTSDAAPGGGL